MPHPSRHDAPPITGRERLHTLIGTVLVPLSVTLWVAAGITLLFGPVGGRDDGAREPDLLPQVLMWAAPATALALVAVVWLHPRGRASRLPWLVIAAVVVAPAVLLLV